MEISDKSVAKTLYSGNSNDCLLAYYTVFVLYEDYCGLAH